MCDECNDQGFILTTRIIRGAAHDYGYRCYCDLGKKKYPTWPEVPYGMAVSKPIGQEVQMEIPDEWKSK